MQLLQHFKDVTLHPTNAKELKGLILQLAIQGKLTADWREENPDVQSASELLEKIREKKIKLLKEKEIRKEKPLPIITNEDIPFTIPNSWKWCRLQEYLDVRDGTHDTPKYVENGFPLVTSKNLYTKKLDLSNIKYISEKDHLEISKRSNVEQNDILFAMIGSIGNPVIVDIEPNFSIKNVALIKYYLKDLSVPSFILFFLEYATQEFKDNSDGAVQSFVSLTKLRMKEFPLPPFEEQQEIVRVVEILFKEVEQLEQLTKERIALKEDFVTSALRQLTTANTETEWNYLQNHFKSFFTEKSSIKKLREAVLQLAVQGKLTVDWRKKNPDTEPATELLKRIQKEKSQLIKDKKIKKESPLPPISDDEAPYKLPDNWVWCRMQNVIKDLRYGTSKKCDYDLGPNPVLRIPNIKYGGIDISNLKTTKLSDKEIKDLSLFPNDLLIIRSNGSESIVGRSAVISNVGIGYSFAGYLVRLQIFKNDVESNYLHTVLESKMIRNAIEGPLRTTSGVKNINSTEIASLIIPIPPTIEQKAIVEKVNALMLLCDQLEQEIEENKNLNEQLMKSVLREVFEENKKKLENV